MSCYPEPDSHSRNKTKLNYICLINCTKSDLKRATSIDTLEFAKKDDLASLQSVVDKFDIDKLETMLSELSNVVKKKLLNRLYTMN